MAGISDKVLARRQKDLNGFTEYYQDRLDKMVGQHMQNMAPSWQRMTKQLTDQIDQLYKEAGALQDPKKIQALQNKAKRLEALASQMAQDLTTASEKLQPYYTGALTAAFEDSYYLNAWGLEQAAQVGVTIPLLSKASVLGVIANPWLPDGANYSSRIRANASYIAAKAREMVEKAVTNGWSVNEAARAMRDVTGEGYFRNVTIMRTELNRAASLGSSYLFMENADILDGKRWNATLDSKTAAKDAANDGEIFDLDYDITAENVGKHTGGFGINQLPAGFAGQPGVPGKRIPNHPNCRCKYSPVLSALGVSRKERIAREGDGPDSWGKNTYTEARTYREYAEKRGLPDLDDRLANDNLKAYLRPGETVADLNKTVTRWNTKGGDVVVNKPAWDSMNKTQLKTAVQPQVTAADWSEVVKARITQGVNTEADVREVGAMVRKRIADRSVDLKVQLDTLDDRREEIIELLNAFDPKDYNSPKYGQLLAEVENLGEKGREIAEKLYADQADALKEVLSDVRPVGPKNAKDLQPFIKGSSTEAKASIEEVRQYLPTDWVEASNRRPMKAKKVKRGHYAEATWKDDEAIKKAGYTLKQLEAAKRLDLVEDTIALSGSGKSMLRCAFHEMGHRIEDMVPAIKKLEKEFYARRTAGESLAWLGPGYKKSEKTRFDNFINKYMGKDYGNKEDSFYELLSMGLESAFKGSYDLTTDTDYADFIYGILAGL